MCFNPIKKTEAGGRLMNESIIVNDIRKTYTLSRKQQKIEKTKKANRRALDGLSFTAYKGETFGLLGPNGAGKTTTLRIIATLISMDSGSVAVNGLDVKARALDIRKKIGFLTSDLKLEEYFSPNYLFDFFSRLYGVDDDTRTRRKKQLFETFGIDKYAEVKVSDLSSGMRQKVSLVIALVHDPEIIVFDEPTNGLDVIAAKVVTDYLKQLQAMGKTILLSTHIFSLAERLCDRVGIIINGKMVRCDTLEVLTREKKLEDLFFELYSEFTGETL